MHINGLLLLIIMESGTMLITLIWLLSCIVKRQDLFPTIAKGKEDIVVKILVFVVVVFIIVNKIIPECKDLPYCYNNEFNYMEGVSQSHSDRSARGGHSVLIKNEDSGEKVRVHFGYKGTIEKGDRLKVKYLPNSKRAILLEINGKKQG